MVEMMVCKVMVSIDTASFKGMLWSVGMEKKAWSQNFPGKFVVETVTRKNQVQGRSLLQEAIVRYVAMK